MSKRTNGLPFDTFDWVPAEDTKSTDTTFIFPIKLRSRRQWGNQVWSTFSGRRTIEVENRLSPQHQAGETMQRNHTPIKPVLWGISLAALRWKAAKSNHFRPIPPAGSFPTSGLLHFHYLSIIDWVRLMMRAHRVMSFIDCEPWALGIILSIRKFVYQILEIERLCLNVNFQCWLVLFIHYNIIGKPNRECLHPFTET